jgi:ubiquitin carboxyl-terminal hydrolase 48
LEDRLDHLVAPEELSGANAYQCPQCEDLTTARRKINLTHLPPILHFSVLRFVYDAELGDRKKSKAIMEFPARVDMSEWLNVNDSRRSTGPMWYELRGIVEHRGASVSPAFLDSIGGLF